MVKEIAFTAYPAKDVAALRRFYSEALGLSFGDPYAEDGVEKYAEAKAGSGWFAIVAAEWSAFPNADAVAFEVDDVEGATAQLRERGVRVEKIHETPVCKIGGFFDPEGNKVTLHQSTLAG